MAINFIPILLIIMGVVIATDFIQGGYISSRVDTNNNFTNGKIPLLKQGAGNGSESDPSTTITPPTPSTTMSTTVSSDSMGMSSTTQNSSGNDKKEKDEKDKKTSLTKLNEKINSRIRLLMESSKKGRYEDNEEFNTHFSILEQALELNEDSIDIKYHSYDRFRQYNTIRLKLEKLITKRMKALTKILIDRHDNVSDYCRKVYKMQLEELDDVLELSNDLKSYKLETNSKTCQSDGDDNDYDDYYYF
ncbi:uncharacterized protein LOC111518625 [Drosophila willistoni]|uniref:uncharacterized protein LOC111518625 n=1 Tax=Drosophila willistoni TaxID=7260 RepID=UPI001F080F99|nr:uncharacterized protein LOC111518625 [Drosophila willistoni]